MSYIIPFTEFGHYLLFSILVGHVVLQFVPEAYKPNIIIAKPVLLLSTLGIILFTFAPLLQLILDFAEDYGFLKAAKIAVFASSIGRAWIIIFILSAFLWITIYVDGAKFFRAQWLVLLIFAIGNAGHASTISYWPGIISHTIHFLMTSIWVGILLNVGWFSRDKGNWSKFLRWFTPSAIVIFIIILTTGFFLMFFMIDRGQYLNSWLVPYGRMLLIKHISIIPVLAFAFINGFLSKKAMKLQGFDPRLWIKAETVTLLIVFFFTGVLGTLTPPHQVDSSLASGINPSWLNWILAKNISLQNQLEILPSVPSALLVLIAVLFLSFIFLSFKKMSPIFAFIFGSCFILTIYLGIMFSVKLSI